MDLIVENTVIEEESELLFHNLHENYNRLNLLASLFFEFQFQLF